MFQPAIYTGSKYCGPTSISCLTGHPTGYVCEKIRARFPNYKRIRGLHPNALLWYLRDIAKLTVIGNHDKSTEWGTLNTWRALYQKRDVVYLIIVSNHYIVLKNNEVCCTQFKGKIESIEKSKYLRRPAPL